MPVARQVHPWVASRRERVTFGLQAFAARDDPDPSRSVIRSGQFADRLGLDAFYLGDHPARATECWMHMAVIAATTERVWLGSVVNCLGYRYPMLIARQAADLDNIAGGRTILGLGIGWDESEFGELGLPYPSIRDRQQALDEAVAIIEGVWGDEPFSFHGRHYAVRNAHVTPAPLQQPRPPLMIAGAGEKVTLRQVARYGDACNFGASPQIGGVRTVEKVRQKLDVLRRHCDEVGRPYDDILRTHFTAWLMIAPTEAEAEAKLRRYYPSGLTEDQRYSRVIGTPAQVATYYQELADAGIQHFVCQSLDAADEETFQLLANDVAPRVALRD